MNARELHERRIRARRPLYAQAIAELTLAYAAGENPRTCWVKALAPLDRTERSSVRAAFLKELERAKVGQARVEQLRASLPHELPEVYE